MGRLHRATCACFRVWNCHCDSGRAHQLWFCKECKVVFQSLPRSTILPEPKDPQPVVIPIPSPRIPFPRDPWPTPCPKRPYFGDPHLHKNPWQTC